MSWRNGEGYPDPTAEKALGNLIRERNVRKNEMEEKSMRELSIAFGNSCMAKKWSNKQVSWEELTNILENTIRTPESVEEYQKMKRSEKEVAKDKSGFVGGQLRDGRRKREAVVSRSMLT